MVIKGGTKRADSSIGRVGSVSKFVSRDLEQRFVQNEGYNLEILRIVKKVLLFV